ncbi:hypothetical protein [Kriegella aquimaris]|uniref:Uncharacterized protein n=1 Tax=Kriegella aquimaris TaxID=192904 RepID=A0A1G9Y9V4_9FLAO|nr:hypothetical protein [Kriegella aquimaris]SDN05909.1 hypothetical protein SAMN04488514_12146 [Kriegella aquimaris]
MKLVITQYLIVFLSFYPINQDTIYISNKSTLWKITSDLTGNGKYWPLLWSGKLTEGISEHPDSIFQGMAFSTAHLRKYLKTGYKNKNDSISIINSFDYIEHHLLRQDTMIINLSNELKFNNKLVRAEFKLINDDLISIAENTDSSIFSLKFLFSIIVIPIIIGLFANYVYNTRGDIIGGVEGFYNSIKKRIIKK